MKPWLVGVTVVGILGGIVAFPRTSSGALLWEIESVTTKANLIRQPNGVLMGSLGWVDGKLHHIGGENNQCGGHDEHYVYNPATDSWSTAPSMQQRRLQFDAAWAGGRLYGIAGSHCCGPMTHYYSESFDPATNTWTRIADLPKKLTQYAAGGVGDKVYVFGGHEGKPGNDPQNFETYIYDPCIGSWATGTAFSPAPEDPNGWPHWTAAAMGSEVYVLSTARGEPGAHIYSYSTITDSWTYRSEVPLPSGVAVWCHTPAHLLPLGDYLAYLHPRELNGEVLMYVYYPEENTWQTVDTSLLHFVDQNGFPVDGPEALADDTGRGFYVLGGQKVGAMGVYSRHLQYVGLAPIPEPSSLIVWSLLAALGITVGWHKRRNAAS